MPIGEIKLRPLLDSEIASLENLKTAIESQGVALARTRLAEDLPAGTEVAMIVGVTHLGRLDEARDAVELVPFGMLIPGNPYLMLEPPEGVIDPYGLQGLTA